MSGAVKHVLKGDYLKVLMALFALTILTVAVAKPVTGFDLGILNAAVAFGIATVKACLVAAIFMNLKNEDKLYMALIITSVFFLIVLYAISMADIATRVPETSVL